MAESKIPLMEDDVEIIKKLGNKPGSENKLQTPELKSKFDEGSVLLKAHLNKVIGILNTLLGSTGGLLDGGNMMGALNMNGYALYGIADPLKDSSAVSKGYMEKYVSSRRSEITVMLPADGWADKVQTVNADGVTADNTVLATPSPGSYEACLNAGVYCSGQGSGTLAFACVKTPSSDVSFNVLIFQ